MSKIVHSWWCRWKMRWLTPIDGEDMPISDQVYARLALYIVLPFLVFGAFACPASCISDANKEDAKKAIVVRSIYSCTTVHERAIVKLDSPEHLDALVRCAKQRQLEPTTFGKDRYVKFRRLD